jgi:hypothetical protein
MIDVTAKLAGAVTRTVMPGDAECWRLAVLAPRLIDADQKIGRRRSSMMTPGWE